MFKAPSISRILAIAALLAAGAGPAGGQTPASDATVAVVGATTISSRDLSARTSKEVEELKRTYEINVRRITAAYDREREATIQRELGALVDEQVLALEATARKSTPAELTKLVTAPAVTDAEVRAFYDANKNSIGEPYEQIASKIREYLSQNSHESAVRTYLDTLRIKHKATITREPVRENVAPSGPRRGPDDAAVTIVEFSDFQCPYCGKYAPTVHEVLQRHPTQAKLYYRHLPLTSLHPNAQKAAEAAVCAKNQGKFWEMHDLLFAEQNRLDPASLKEKARRLGLNAGDFDACLDTGKAVGEVRADVDAADQLGLTGTPATFVNGRFVNGAASAKDLNAVIDDELRRAAPAAHR